MRGMTVRTVYGSVDMAPLLRRLNGESAPRVPDWERRAAVAALTDMAIPVVDIAAVVNMNCAMTAAAVREYKRVRHSHEVIENAVIGHAIWIARRQTQERECLRAANAKARVKRLSQRIEVDGYWFHPRAPHGTNTGYNGFGCRCRGPQGCHEAHMQNQRERRAAA